MSDKRNIIVWSWSREPSLVPVGRLVDEGLVDVVLWVSMLEGKDFLTKTFSYIPSLMLDELDELARRSDVYYRQDADQLTRDVAKFIDVYSRVNNAKGKDYFEHLNLFHLYYQYFTNLLITRKVDAVLYFGAPHVGVDYILYLAARALGVETVVMFQSFVPNRFFSVRTLEDYGTFEEHRHLGEPVELTIPRGHEKKHFYMSKIKNKRSLQLHKFFEDCLRATFPSRQPLSWTGVWQNMGKRWDYRRNYSRYVSADVDLSKKFVYFPLQMQPELTTTILGKEYSDQLLAIERLSAMLPEDWYIYVKENPKQGQHQRGAEFYHRLSRIPNCVYVDITIDTYDLMRASQFVASVTGTACWESITGGKPAMIFGQIWYMSYPGITVYREGLTVDDVMGNTFTHEELERAHSELHARSIPGIMGMSYAAIYPEYDEQVNQNLLTDYLKRVLGL